MEGGGVRLLGVALTGETDGRLADDVRWMRRSDARRLFGVGKDILDSWVADGKVEAHKLNPGRNGTVIFSVRDVSEVIRNSPVYKPERKCALSVA